ncbi:MAG: RNA-binding cell elongation regulator Jag/EloR [Desulfovibrionales bacterium]
MSENKEFTGKTVDDAIQNACEYFGMEREKLEIEILEGGSSGIFGLMGLKKAKIQAQARDNQREAEDLVRSVVEKLTAPIVQKDKIRVNADRDTVKVIIDDDENSGLIIGRDGQTLSSFQYIVNRIVSRQWPEKLRVHIDTGDYRERQNENLKSTALFLADKAKSSGRTQSTKPLTSYHRRLVHMALQRDDGVQTRSKGEGPLKRVLIFPRKNRKSSSDNS